MRRGRRACSTAERQPLSLSGSPLTSKTTSSAAARDRLIGQAEQVTELPTEGVGGDQAEADFVSDDDQLEGGGGVGREEGMDLGLNRGFVRVALDQEIGDDGREVLDEHAALVRSGAGDGGPEVEARFQRLPGRRSLGAVAGDAALHLQIGDDSRCHKKDLRVQTAARFRA